MLEQATDIKIWKRWVLNLNNKSYYNFIDKKTIPLVFIHGVGLDHKMWSPQINYFKNYSTITYDLLGHGRTPFKKEKIKMQDYIEQLLSIIEFLKLEKINLVGFSIGSLIALNFATDFQNKLNSLLDNI